jgi:apolipoprotein N-acyltransferase
VALAGASGALFSLANPTVDAGWVAFVALVPFLLAFRGAGAKRGTAIGLTFGLVYYGILLGWLRPFGVIAWLPLVARETLYTTLFAMAWPLLRRPGHPQLDAVTAAGLWTAVDRLRAIWPVGGFTWGGLGYTQHGNPFLLPVASITGVWGITFVVMLVNGLAVAALAGRARGRPWWGRGIPVGIAAATVLLPALIPLSTARGPRLDVAVIQGNVPSAMAHDLLLRGDTVEANEISLHRTLVSRPPDLVVWPENSLDEDPSRDPTLAANIAAAVRTVGAPTLIGGIRAHGTRVSNSILAYSGQGRLVGSYDKVHLVPFGEYVPFPSLFHWTERYRRGNADFTAGTRIRVFRVAGTTLGTPICFENTFPDLFRRFVAEGARLMVVSTNDSSFLRSPASSQHVVFSQLRAVETGRWVVHAAVSGESVVVDPRGRIRARTGLFQRTVLRFDVPTSTARTYYTRWGDWFPWACGIGCLAGLAWSLGRRRRSGRPPAPPAGERASEPRRDASVSSDRSALPISGGADPRVLVVLPTYNEGATISAAVAGVLAVGPNVRVLVVDDDSPDGTGEVVAALAEQEPRVTLVRRNRKAGLAGAYLLGFRRSLEGGYDVTVEMDADLSHRPEDLPAVLAGSGRYDLTIGSRYVPGGQVSNWSRSRLLLSRAGNAYARAVLALPIADATSGFRAFRQPLLEKLVAERTTADGYAFQVELAYRAWQLGFSVGEVPIVFREREHGRSKLSRPIVLEALLKIAQWGVRDRLIHRPKQG